MPNRPDFFSAKTSYTVASDLQSEASYYQDYKTDRQYFVPLLNLFLQIINP